MTVQEALALCDDLKPNTYETGLKIKWLSEAEMLVRDEILLTHEPSDILRGLGKLPFDQRVPLDRALAVPAPYDGLYPYYLHTMIDRSNGDATRYANSSAAFAAAYNSFAAYYNRTYAPRGTGQNFKLFGRAE